MLRRAHSFVLLGLVALTLIGLGASALGIPHHSLSVPILQNYENNGLPFWSFGGATVITDDAVILGPPEGAGHGYLWNQQPNGLASWQMQFTALAAHRERKSFASLFKVGCRECGVAFWYLSEPARHKEQRFFGVPDAFTGLGVILHEDRISVVVNRGSPIFTFNSIIVGSCTAVSIADESIDLAIDYMTETKTVVVEWWRTSDAAGAHTRCTSVPNVELEERWYFGFTAVSDKVQHVNYAVSAIEVLAEAGAQEEGGSIKGNWSEFDLKLEAEEKAFWNGRGDVPPPMEVLPPPPFAEQP